MLTHIIKYEARSRLQYLIASIAGINPCWRQMLYSYSPCRMNLF